MANCTERATKRRRLELGAEENTHTSPLRSPSKHKQRLCSSPLKTRNSPASVNYRNSPRKVDTINSPRKISVTALNSDKSPTKQRFVDSPIKVSTYGLFCFTWIST